MTGRLTITTLSLIPTRWGRQQPVYHPKKIQTHKHNKKIANIFYQKRSSVANIFHQKISTIANIFHQKRSRITKDEYPERFVSLEPFCQSVSPQSATIVVTLLCQRESLVFLYTKWVAQRSSCTLYTLVTLHQKLLYCNKQAYIERVWECVEVQLTSDVNSGWYYSQEVPQQYLWIPGSISKL